MIWSAATDWKLIGSAAQWQLGQAAGVPTPVNRAVSDILALHADGKLRA